MNVTPPRALVDLAVLIIDPESRRQVHVPARRILQQRGRPGCPYRTGTLAPGLTDTPGMRASVDDAHIARVAAAYPGGRLGQPEDVVSFAAFLCSDAATHLSGTLLPIRPTTG